jgi:hypothetical protein
VGEPPTFRRKPVGQRNCYPKWSSVHAHHAGHAQASTGYRPTRTPELRSWLPRCPATACSGCAAAACFAARNGWVNADGVLTRLATDADTRLRNQNQPSTSTSGGLGIGRVPKAIGTPSSARLERWFHSPTLWPEAEVRILPMTVQCFGEGSVPLCRRKCWNNVATSSSSFASMGSNVKMLRSAYTISGLWPRANGRRVNVWH